MEEKQDYKGCTIKIIQDDDCESPSSWGNDNIFLVGYHQDFWVEAPGYHRDRLKDNSLFSKDDLIYHFNHPKEKSIFKDYHIFKLEAYIHSGVQLALAREGNFPDRQWDVSQIGAIFISKKETRYTKKARTYALGLIDTWNDYLSGNVYGFRSIDENGTELDSCWGFYGNPKKSGIIEEAKSAIDSYLEDKREALGSIIAMA